MIVFRILPFLHQLDISRIRGIPPCGTGYWIFVFYPLILVKTQLGNCFIAGNMKEEGLS